MEQPENIPVVEATNTPLRRNILVEIDGNFNNVENVYVAPILENCPLISPERLCDVSFLWCRRHKVEASLGASFT